MKNIEELLAKAREENEFLRKQMHDLMDENKKIEKDLEDARADAGETLLKASIMRGEVKRLQDLVDKLSARLAEYEEV